MQSPGKIAGALLFKMTLMFATTPIQWQILALAKKNVNSKKKGATNEIFN
jgi:hypothetical protein